MTMKTMMHDPAKILPHQVGDTAWLEITSSDRNSVVVFMDYAAAIMIADAWWEYENMLSSQEGPTYDDALGAKCDAKERLDRDLREAGRK